VFGEGLGQPPAQVFVGEAAGRRRGQSCRPFVGPAGKLLDRALEEAGIDRKLVYVTNVVKHFKWTPRGKAPPARKSPNAREIAACKPWLLAELAVIQQEVLVCLGSTAAQVILGRTFKVTQMRGTIVEHQLAPQGDGHRASVVDPARPG